MWLQCSLALLLAGSACAARDRQSGTPVQKVAVLLTKLRSKVQEQGAQEAASYDRFACFCKAQADGKQHAISRSDAAIAELTATVDALASDIAQLDSDVGSRKTDLESYANESAAALATRQAAQATYLLKRGNLTQAVSAIDSALETMRASRDGVRGAAAASLLARLPAQVASLIEAAAGAAVPGSPPAYQYSSTNITATLQSLSRTFKAELARVEAEEASALHDHNMLEGARAQSVAAIQAEIDQKQKISAEKSETKSTKEGLLADETAARSADQAFLQELTSNCQAKAQAWDQRSQTRAAEITAMTEAIGILQGMGDLYNVNSKLVGLLATRQREAAAPADAARAVRAAPIARHRSPGAATLVQPAALLQLEDGQGNAGRAKAALSLLAQRGEALGSPLLLALSARNATGGDPFVQVRSLVKDLIARLEGEASSEASQKTLCDSSMKAAVEKRDRYQADAESAAALLDSTKSEISSLKGDVSRLAGEIANLHKALNDLTDLRNDEKALNSKTVADANAGAAAVRQAIAVLKQFYDSQPALLQVRNITTGADRDGNTVADLAPTTFSGDYTGKADASKGIFGLLEVIASDFERTSTTTAQAETKAESEFQAQSTSLNGDITAKSQEKTTKEGDIQTKETSLIQQEDDLKSKTKLHEGVLQELETLRSTCVVAGESWEQRKQRREQEIEALKQALAVLEDWKS